MMPDQPTPSRRPAIDDEAPRGTGDKDNARRAPPDTHRGHVEEKLPNPQNDRSGRGTEPEKAPGVADEAHDPRGKADPKHRPASPRR